MNKCGFSTEHFYKEVINKVLDQSREYFAQFNVSEEVLAELKKLWCEKLTNTGIFNANQRQMFGKNHQFDIPGGFRNEFNNNFIRK